MVRMETRDFGQDEWNDMVSIFDDFSLMQTWEFGEAKAKIGPWKVWRAVFREGDELVGAAQAMIRTIPLFNRGLVWINRAPLLKDKDMLHSDIYIDILKELKKYWVDQKRMYLRIAPPLTASDNSYAIFKKAGFSRATDAHGWASEIVDLSLPIEKLRMGLQQKWRNCLNKAERLRVTCEVGNSADLVDELLSDYKSLIQSKSFNTSVTPELIRTIQDFLPDSRKMVVFAGRKDGEKLGSILIATYGKSSMYLIGATNDAGRKVNANHYLIWNAVCEMKKRGYKWFDVGGAHPDNTPRGILHFKRGLRGKPYQLMGEVEAYKNNFINKLLRKRLKSARGRF